MTSSAWGWLPGIFDGDGNKGNAEDLIRWYDEGADGAIDWCTHGDFEDCVSIAGKHVDNPEGFCNERHQDACGGPPGSEDKSSVRDQAATMRENASMTTGLKTRDAIIASFQADVSVALADSYSVVTAAAEARLGSVPYWALISQAERDDLAKSGAAMPDGSYPITTCDGENSVDTAIKAVGRGGADHDGIRRHIMKRADDLGCRSLIPDTWNADGSLADDDAKAGATGQAMADTPPPPPAPGEQTHDGDADADPTGEGGPEDAKIDAVITDDLDQLDKMIDDLIAKQATDPGTGAEAGDTKVMADLQALKEGVTKAKASQAADNAVNPPGAPVADKGQETTPPAADAQPDGSKPAKMADATPATTPGNDQGVPNDADDSAPAPGDIEANLECQNPACKHLAAMHANDVTNGDNTGPCTTPSCDCTAMIPPADVINATGPDSSGGGPNNEAGDDVAPETSATHAAGDSATFAPGDPVVVPTGPEAPPVAPDAPAIATPPQSAALPPLNPSPQVAVGAPFTIPVAWIEGVQTGDGRMIEPGALTWRTPPLPLMGLKTSPHDPSGMSGNDPAVLIGRIESIEVDGPNGVARGHLLATDEGQDFADILEQMGRMGVSIDVGSAEVQTTADPTIDLPPGGSVFDAPLLDVLTKGEVMGMTVCPFAAFAGAYIVLGDGTDVPDATVPAPPADAKMAIHYVDETPCVPCGEEAAPIVASAGSGPSLLHPPSAWFADPGFGRDAEGNKIDPRLDPRLVETIDPKTGRGSGKFACPPTITDDGRVMMHIAQWGVCHQSPKFLNSGQCVLAPRSRVDYAAFHGTGSVVTAEGERIGVGRLTADTGHASDHHSVDFRRALAHYDNSGLTTALTRAGEDEFGIWVAGALHPSASEEQVYTMRSNPPSGDWRPFGAGTELCQVLFVNHPGFPMVVAEKRPQTGQITRLVAAGVPVFTMPEIDAQPRSIEDRLAAIEKGIAPVYDVARDSLRRRRDALRG